MSWAENEGVSETVWFTEIFKDIDISSNVFESSKEALVLRKAIWKKFLEKYQHHANSTKINPNYELKVDLLSNDTLN